MGWAEIKKAVNSDLTKPLNVKIDELAEPGMFGQDLFAGFRFLRGAYPYNQNAGDIIINTNTTWDDLVGYKRVGRLTIAANIKLTIAKFPFFILADEITFGNTNSWICADGLSGSEALTPFPQEYSAGGTYSSSPGGVQCGCGGGLLFVICNSISGANGKITANGGDGYRLDSGPSTSGGRGGQGALSNTRDTSATTGERWKDGVMGALGAGMGDGGDYSDTLRGGTGGGSAGSSSLYGAGGSGIGGGGGSDYSSGTIYVNGRVPIITPSPAMLMFYAQMGCKGGGGGGGFAAATKWVAGGGGGGAVVVYYKTKTATPTLEANGGIGVTSGAAANGAAGQTWLLEV